MHMDFTLPSFPKTEQGFRLLQGLAELIDDLTAITDRRQIHAPQHVVSLNGDLDESLNVPWYQDNDITSDVGGPALRQFQVPWLPACGNETNLKGTVRSIVYEMLSPNAKFTDPRAVFTPDNTGADLPNLSNYDPTSWEGLIIMYLATSDTPRFLELFHRTLDVAWHALELWRRVDRDLKSMAAPVDPKLVDETRGVIESYAGHKLARITYHRVLIEFLFIANPRFLCLLDLSIQIDLNLLWFLTSAYSQQVGLQGPDEHSWMNAPFLLRCIGYKAWIRWGWYTNNNKRHRRDLYIALDCLEESIVADAYVGEEIPSSELAPRMFTLSRFYRTAHKYSGSLEELKHALNWGRQGLELLLEVDRSERDWKSVQVLIVTAQYDLSRMLGRLFEFTHFECDASEAFNLAHDAMKGLGSNSDTYQALPAELVEGIEYNYRYCRSRTIFRPEVSPFANATSHPYQHLLRQRIKRQTTSDISMQVPRATLQALSRQQRVVDKESATMEFIRSAIENLPGMGLDSCGNLIIPSSWLVDSDQLSPVIWNQIMQCTELLLTIAEIPGPHLEILHKSDCGTADPGTQENALTLMMLNKFQGQARSRPLTDTTRLRQLLDRWEAGEHDKALGYTELYAHTGDNRDREAAIRAFDQISSSPLVLASSGDRADLGKLRLDYLKRAVEMHWDHFQATQDAKILATTVKYVTQLLDEARVQREALKCICGGPEMTPIVTGPCQAEGCRSPAIKSALLSVSSFLHPLRESIPGITPGSDQDPQMTYMSTIGTMFDIPPDFRFLLDFLMPSSSRNFLPCIFNHAQLSGELSALKHAGAEGDTVGQLRLGFAILKFLLPRTRTMESDWRQVYQESLHALLSLVPHYFNLASTLEERTTYQNRDMGLNVLVDFLTRGSSLVLKYESASVALQFLEIARGTIFRNMLEYRVDLGDLTLSHPAYAAEVAAILLRLDVGFAEQLPELLPGARRVDFFTTFTRMGERGQDVDRLQELLKEIRRLPGYENFMFPKYEGEQFALDAARDGPIVLVSAFGNSHGYAILVLNTGITSIPLPGLTEEGAKTQLRVLSEMKECYLITVQEKLRAMLKWLWETVVHPILIALGFAGSKKLEIDLTNINDVSMLPRCWWIGIGLMSQAPFHAAGKFPGSSFGSRMHKAQYTAQYCISSYTPTIKALMSTRRRLVPRQTPAKSPKKPQATSPSSNDPLLESSTYKVPNIDTGGQFNMVHTETIDGRGQENSAKHKTLIVTMPCTPAEDQMDPSGHLAMIRGSTLCDLDVKSESRFVKEAIKSIDGTADFLPSPEVDDVLFHLNNYNIVHFACHGEVDEINPLKSRLVFQKSRSAGNMDPPVRDYLTIRDILLVRNSQSHTQKHNLKLVYLSACSSASNRCSELSHEPLHIASVFQLAGFNHAIGTLWDSDDDVCVEVAHLFYQYLARIQAKHLKGKDREESETREGCAEALHIAVELVRRRLWKAPHLWATFMHWGA